MNTFCINYAIIISFLYFGAEYGLLLKKYKKIGIQFSLWKGFCQNFSTNRVDYVVTNNKTQKSSKAAQDEFSFLWVIESMHREIKQLTGFERCQCRKQRIQRNHISCAFLVWAFLKRTANTIGKTVYS